MKRKAQKDGQSYTEHVLNTGGGELKARHFGDGILYFGFDDKEKFCASNEETKCWLENLLKEIAGADDIAYMVRRRDGGR